MARKSLIPAGTFLPEGDAANPSDTGLLGRIVQKDAVKHGRRPETPEREAEEEAGSAQMREQGTRLHTDQQEVKSYDKSYGNMTSNKENSIPIRKEGYTDGKTVGNTDSLAAGNTVSLSGSQEEGQLSIRAAIQATIQKAGQAPEVLKTVTLKLAPSLDRRVEEHCFQTGRKKQEVVRDALLLYFEAIEEGEGE